MKTRKLNRDTHSRSALFRGQISSLIEKEEIVTTDGKAKTVKSLFEKVVTKARSGSIHARRQIQSVLIHDSLVTKVMNEIAPRYKDSHGGYTKMTMVGTRKGDGAMMVKLALTIKAKAEAKEKVSAKKEEKEAAKTTAPKVAAPKVAKPTKSVKGMGSSVGKVRKTGER